MKKLIGLALVLASALLVGCITDTSGVVVENGRLTVYNQRFASHLRMSHQLRRNTATGFVHAQVVLENMDSSDFAFQYRFEWTDADGMLIEETSPMWHVASVHGRDRKILEGVSESKNAADFRLVIRELK